MPSVSRRQRHFTGICLGCLLSIVACLQNSLAAALRCPGRLPGPHPGFAQVGPVPTAHWLLWRMRLFDAQPGSNAAKELAPAGEVRQGDSYAMTWNLTGNEALVMVCLYDGSGTYYEAWPNPLPTSCALRDDNGLTLAWCEQR